MCCEVKSVYAQFWLSIVVLCSLEFVPCAVNAVLYGDSYKVCQSAHCHSLWEFQMVKQFLGVSIKCFLSYTGLPFSTFTIILPLAAGMVLLLLQPPEVLSSVTL